MRQPNQKAKLAVCVVGQFLGQNLSGIERERTEAIQLGRVETLQWDGPRDVFFVTSTMTYTRE